MDVDSSVGADTFPSELLQVQTISFKDILDTLKKNAKAESASQKKKSKQSKASMRVAEKKKNS